MNQKFVEEVSQETLYNSKNPLVRYAHRKRLENVLQLMGNTEKKIVLDIGCGEGFMIEKLKGKVIGIDYSTEKLASAKKRLKHAMLVRADATMLPFKNNSFDSFVASEVFEHIPNLEKVAEEILRVAKKNSSLVVSAPNEKNWRIARLLLLRFPIKLEGHINELTPKALDKLFKTKATKRKHVPDLPFGLCLTHISKYLFFKEQT